MDSSSSDSRSDYEIRQFKFDELPDYAEISSFKPRGFKTPGGSYKISSWREAYRIFCRYLLKEKPRHIRAFKNLEETFLGRRVMFSNDPFLLNEAYQLRSGFYAEIFLPPKSIIHNISRLIQFCRLSPRQFVVTIPVYVDESELSELEEVEDEQNEVESQLSEPEQPEEEVSEDETIQESVSEQPSSQIVHFTLEDDIPALAFSKPVAITIGRRRLSIFRWREVMIETARYIVENEPASFRYLYRNCGPKSSSRKLFSHDRSDLLEASKVDSNLFVETKFGAVDCVKKALLFIRYTNISPSRIRIEYLPAGAVNSDNPIPAESANINTEPEEEPEDIAVVENNASEQSQTETAAIESEEDTDIPRTDERKPEEFENDKKADNLVDDNEVGFSDNDLETLSFTLDDPIPNLKFSKPTAISFGKQIASISSWTSVLMQTAIYIDQNEPDAFNYLVKQYGDSGTGLRLFSHHKFENLTCKQINSNYYVNTNFSAADTVKQAQLLMQSCKLPLSEVRIEYIPGNANGAVRAQNIKTENNDNAKESGSRQSYSNDYSTFTKPVNLSMFFTCVVIPKQCHKAFLDNLTVDLKEGMSETVTLWFNDEKYRVVINNLNFSSTDSSTQIRFTWNPNLPIAIALRKACPESFQILERNSYSALKESKPEVSDTITVSCGNKPDEFILQVNSQKASGVIQERTVQPDEKQDKPGEIYYKYQPEAVSERLIDDFGFSPEERKELITRIEELVPAVFPNGSCREGQLGDLLNRLDGQFSSQDALERFIIDNNIAVECRGWVYFLVSDIKNCLYEVLRQLQREGQILAFYGNLWNKKSDVFTSVNIYKDKELLSKLFTALKEKDGSQPELEFYPTKDWLALQEDATIKTALIDCFSRISTLSYDQFEKELPYIPFSELRLVILGEPEFIRVANGVYTFEDKIWFDSELSNKLIAFVQSEIEKHGYVSCGQLDFSEAMEFNPGLSEDSLRDYFCQKYLPKRYKRKGNIISDFENPTDTGTLISEFCKSKPVVTYDELKNFAADLNAADQTALIIAFDNMVRVDKDRFVDPESVHFDVDEIDREINTYISGDFIPLQDVYDIESFPAIDSYHWNWFLLESFCRKYSRQFDFMVAKINSQNVGVIIRKSSKYENYNSLMATAVDRSGIDLTEKAISSFLLRGHYIAKQNPIIVQKVLEQARILRDSSGE